MTDVRVKPQQQSVSRANDGGGWVAWRSLRDGAGIVVPWVTALILEGRCFAADAGKVDSLLTIMTTYADTSKTIFVDVPDGTAMIPLQANFTFGATGGAIDYAKLFVSETLNGVGGTETLITPRNLLLGETSPATTATAAHTASSAVDTVTGTEVTLLSWYVGQDLDAVGISPVLYWSCAESGATCIGLNGSSFNLACFCNTSGTGCGQLIWAELPESAIL